MISRNDLLKDAFLEYIKLTSSTWLRTALDNIDFILTKFTLNLKFKYPFLGRLSFKEEAAGKLRVFAMVDVLTQSLLKPLHDHLFYLFRFFPNDGTHDQEKAFKLAQNLADKYNACYGFDLSSATDRLPLSSQIVIINSLFNNNLGDSWARLLVGRSYQITENEYSIPVGPIYYSVGQPMGALSS